MYHIKAVIDSLDMTRVDYDYDDVIAVVITKIREGKCYLYWYELLGIDSRYEDFGLGIELIEIPRHGNLLAGPLERPIKEFFCKSENITEYVSRFLPKPIWPYSIMNSPCISSAS